MRRETTRGKTEGTEGEGRRGEERKGERPSDKMGEEESSFKAVIEI